MVDRITPQGNLQLLAQMRTLLDVLWQESELERDAIRGTDAARVNSEPGGETIVSYIDAFAYILSGMSDETVRLRVFPTGRSEQLDPQSFEEWIERWGILENSAISDWLVRNGNSCPRLSSYLLALDSIRSLLLRIKAIDNLCVVGGT